jgi:hypothetical protein
MGKSTKAVSAATRVRRILANKRSASAGGSAAREKKATPGPSRTQPPAAPATHSRTPKIMTADATAAAQAGNWKDAHIDFKRAEFAKDLARSPIEKLFEDLDLDMLRTPFGDIVASTNAGQVDYKALAIAQLGADKVAKLEAAYRKPSTKVPRALSSWALEAGLPE